jgi:hypothetical protein
MRQFPFPPVWIGGDLGDFRSCDSTYCRFDYRLLPRLPTYQFDGTFSWLRRHPSPLEYDSRFAGAWGKDGPSQWKVKAERIRPDLLKAARDCGVTIPDTYMTLLFDVDLVSMMRFPTDCYFRLSKTIISNRGPQGGHFVHFLSDSQNCYEWYLFVDPKDRHCVVASFEDLSQSTLPERFWENDRQEIVYCARSFEAFVFRLWIENEIWFRLEDQDQPLTDEMVEYLRASRDSREAEP